MLHQFDLFPKGLIFFKCNPQISIYYIQRKYYKCYWSFFSFSCGAIFKYWHEKFTCDQDATSNLLELLFRNEGQPNIRSEQKKI